MKKQNILFHLWTTLFWFGLLLNAAPAAALTQPSEDAPITVSYLDGERYKTERTYWETGTDGKRHLKAQTWEDREGTVIKCLRYTYDTHGNRTCETIYGNLSGQGWVAPVLNSQGTVINEEAGVESYAIRLAYDPDHPTRLLSRTEDNGKTTSYLYNDQTSLKTTELISDGTTILQRRFFEYDALNRLIKIITDDGRSADLHDMQGVRQRSATLFDYDEGNESYDFNEISIKEVNSSGQIVSEMDGLNNTTTYYYDDLGRVSKVVLPSVLDEDETLRIPSVHYKYDILNNITELTDAKGRTVYMRYNAYGKPTEQLFHDGSKEILIYNLDGSLCEKVGRDGITMHYTYDLLGRETFVEVIDSAGRKLSSLASIYSGFQLVKTVQNEQITTLYTYDSNGKIQSKQRQCPDGIQRAQFTYDDHGRMISQTESWGLGPRDSLVTTYHYDATGNLAKTVLSDSAGAVLKEIPIEPAERSERTFQEGATTNERGQTVRQTTSIDENGQKVTITYDALNRAETIVVTNSLGQTTQHTGIRHDLAGNKTKETIYDPTTQAVMKTNTWAYEGCHRLMCYTEAADTASARPTYYSYDTKGHLAEVVTPKGIGIYYRYSEGLLEEYFAGDFSFHYHFVYDGKGRLIRVEDRCHQTSCKRQYNTSGQLTHEQLGNGLKIRNTYDALGRRIQLILPDYSLIAFEYDPLYIRTIKRYSNKGKLQYSHTYSEYDLKGRVAKSTLIGAAGTLELDYNQDGFCRFIRSPHWSQQIPEWGINSFHHIVALQGQDACGTWNSSFSYDSKQQIVEETGAFAHSYTYDESGNRQSIDEISYQSDLLNQLCSQESEQENIQYEYDLNGNLISITSQNTHTSYQYDALDRLICVNFNEQKEVRFIYDVWNRRLSKTVSIRDSLSSEWIHQTTHRYLYDGNKEIGVVDDRNVLIELRLLGTSPIGEDPQSEIGAAIAYELNGIPYAPIHDHRGNMCCLINASTGEMAESYRYSAFGELTVFSATGTPLAQSALNTPWLFSSKRYDIETGLIFYGKRYYSPSIGKWLTKDPLGSIDGTNSYLFLHNNPLSQIDTHGLFSISAAWKSIKDFAYSLANKLCCLKSQLSLTDQLEQPSSSLAEHIFSKGFLQLAGYYVDPIDNGTTPYGEEINGKVRVTFINGILNIRQDLEETLKLFSSSHGNIPIHYVYRPTEGWTKDIMSSTLSKMGFISPYAKLLAQTWKEMIQEMGGVGQGGKILHYAHSIGATDTYVARTLLTPEERQMIHVISIGSPTMIPQSSGFGSVMNYVSKRDGVCFLDPIGYATGYFSDRVHVEPIGSIVGVPFIDHTIFSDSYRQIINELGTQFVETYQ